MLKQMQKHVLSDSKACNIITYQILFVSRFYGPVNPRDHVERGQFT